MSDQESLNIAEIRSRIAGKKGRDYWAALGDLADDPSVRKFLDGPDADGQPGGAGWDKSITRRQMLKFMGASLALAGLGACTRQPLEKIFPYAEQPERMVPGRPLYFSTALTRQGVARGVLVESHMGRPTKVEGNPRHPDSLGSTDAFMQAEILNLYDPDRMKAVLNEGRISSWPAFLADLRGVIERAEQDRGAGLRFLTETVTSPSEAALIRRILKRFPAAKWHQYESVNRDAAFEGGKLAFGRAVDAIYRLDQAERVLALDSDFLFSQPGSVRYTRDYSQARQAQGERRNRLYAVEPTPTVTGSMADHRFAARASEIESIADHIARRLGVAVRPEGAAPGWVDAVAKDLLAHRGRSVVIPGEFQTPRLHALAHAMNRALGAVGRTVELIDPVQAEPVNQMESLQALQRSLWGGEVECLVIVGVNPVFTAPADLQFAAALARAPKRVYLGSHRDETARVCHWAIPQAHELETWGDAKAYDGTITIQQPLIAPLYDGKSPLELLSVFVENAPVSAHDTVREHGTRALGLGAEDRWRKAVHDGVLEGSAHRPLSLVARDPAARETRAPSDAIEISVRPDPSVWDGRHANNGWLQELPRPITTLTWDNVAHMSASDAERLGVENGRIIEIEAGRRRVMAPVWVTPGQAPGALTLTLGYGRTYAGRLGTGAGFSAEALRGSASPWLLAATLKATRKTLPLSKTQEHHQMEGRDPVRVREHGEAHREETHEAQEPLPTLLPVPPAKSERYAWGMSIDLDACVGCNACTIACQAENNIPVVGKSEVARGREMHWIRIDRYQEGPSENPELLHQPVPCMHCENAPCETVCPVGATTHSEEGLNEMTYNRCVGTRYCSNNCPYKVRRFNFYQYADIKTESLKLMRNPDVTVRDRGVMEKCTYCVQRINVARIDAEKDGRDVKDGEIKTACQQACPATAIVFGNLLEKTSELVKSRGSDRHYGLLTELNTKPRTTYLARVRNLNPEIAHG